MGYKVLGFAHTAVALADLSGSYGCGVALDANGKMILPAAGAAMVGVLTDKPVAGQEAGYQFLGIAEAKLGGTVAVNDRVKLDALGRFVTASASDVAAGQAQGLCLEGGTINQFGTVLLLHGSAGFAGTGVDDIVLGTTVPSALTAVTYAQVNGTKTGALGAGLYVGQKKDIVQSVATGTPIGTITGAFKTWAGVAATSLALGTAVGFIIAFVWDGAAWRQVSAIGGTASALT